MSTLCKTAEIPGGVSDTFVVLYNYQTYRLSHKYCHGRLDMHAALINKAMLAEKVR